MTDSNLPTTTAQLETPVNERCRFLELPAELRLQVYGNLVVVGKIFYSPEPYCVQTETRFKDWKLYGRPSLQILGTSKGIRKEAEEVYTTKNLFVLPDLYQLRQPFRGAAHKYTEVAIPDIDRWLFSDGVAKKLKNVSVYFNMRDLFPRFADHRTLGDNVNFQGPSQPQRLKTTHDNLFSRQVSY